MTTTSAHNLNDFLVSVLKVWPGRLPLPFDGEWELSNTEGTGYGQTLPEALYNFAQNARSHRDDGRWDEAVKMLEPYGPELSLAHVEPAHEPIEHDLLTESCL